MSGSKTQDANGLPASMRLFVRDHPAASLATVSEEGKPHISIVYSIVLDKTSFYFASRVEGRKFINLSLRPDVAMTFYDEKRLQMLQLSGTTTRIDNLDDEIKILHELMRVRRHDPRWPVPPMQLFERGSTNEVAIMEIVPTELTFADFGNSDADNYHPIFHKII